MSSSGIDYFNYIYSLSGIGTYFYSQSLINLDGDDENFVNDYIRKNAYVGDSSFSKKFNNKVSEINIQYHSDNKLRFNITLICGTASVVLLFILAIYYAFKVYYQILVFLNLLRKLDLNFIKKLLYEMKFICKEIQKTNYFCVKTCSFPTSFDVVV